MERIVELLHQIVRVFRSRYVRELEREVERLRAENRAMMNSLLGTAGIPPLQIPETRPEARRHGSEVRWRRPGISVGARRAVPAGAANGGVRKGSPGRPEARSVGNEDAQASLGSVWDEAEPAPRGSAIPAVRRRSWQQIGRILEIEEARRERDHAMKMTQIRLRPEALAAEAQEKGSGKPNGRVRS